MEMQSVNRRFQHLKPPAVLCHVIMKDNHNLQGFCVCQVTSVREEAVSDTARSSSNSLNLKLKNLKEQKPERVNATIVVECERDRKGKRRSLSFLLGKGISYAYVQVCVRACEQWI
ncbi:hypothetical protein ROHU_030934 [Labeo rohita]|uniref:Uncharacterized protein n=1 Tax=Labeo rohita TaxID=84645 RepID=A0A498LPP5_LABRO|nr:hypothetical protein ROHU_030934 [Labeo rohita]